MDHRHKFFFLGSAGNAGGAVEDLTPDMISFWELEEASGTRVDAVTASGNDLTDNNTVTQAVGKVGNAAQFVRANSEFLSRLDNASLSTGNIDFTIAAWVYLDSKPAGYMAIAGKGVENATREWDLIYGTTEDQFLFTIFPSIRQAASAAGISTATWYLVIGWHDAAADTVNIQVNNGSVVSTATVGDAPPDTTGGFSLGRPNDAVTTLYWDGRLDQVGFWKRVLTAAERSFLYNSGNGRAFSEL